MLSHKISDTHGKKMWRQEPSMYLICGHLVLLLWMTAMSWNQQTRGWYLTTTVSHMSCRRHIPHLVSCQKGDHITPMPNQWYCSLVCMDNWCQSHRFDTIQTLHRFDTSKGVQIDLQLLDRCLVPLQYLGESQHPTAGGWLASFNMTID